MIDMTRIIDPEWYKLAEMVDPYIEYDREKGEVYIKKDAPKEIHEAYERKNQIYYENQHFL